MDRISTQKVDIFLGNHMQHNETLKKYDELLKGNTEAFINQDEWKNYCQWAKENLLYMIRKENEQ